MCYNQIVRLQHTHTHKKTENWKQKIREQEPTNQWTKLRDSVIIEVVYWVSLIQHLIGFVSDKCGGE